MQVLVLRLDYKSSLILENLQKQAAAAQVSKRQLPPHLTLQTFQHADSKALEQIVKNSIPKLTDTVLTFSSLGFFKQNGTFFISLAASKVLLDMHSDIHSAVHGLQGQSSCYEPGHWTPHATIIADIPAPFWGPMFARLSMEFEPFKAKAAAIECWTVTDNHIETDWSLFLDRVPLKKNDSHH